MPATTGYHTTYRPELVHRNGLNNPTLVSILLCAFKDFLPAGDIILSDVEEETRLSMGWISLAHLCRDLRTTILADSGLWSEHACFFPTTSAIEEIDQRTAGLGVSFDFDRLFIYASPPRVQEIIDHLFNHQSPAYKNARAFICTSSRTPGITSLSKSFWATSAGRTFCHLTTLDMFLASPSLPVTFNAPFLKFLTIRGIRETKDLVEDAWKLAPRVTVSSLRGFVANLPELDRVYLRGIDVEADLVCLPIIRSFSHVEFELYKPISVFGALLCLSGGLETNMIMKTHAAYADPLPEWVWSSASINERCELAVVLETSRTMTWITLMPLEDLPTSLDPTYCDGTDPLDISPPRQHRCSLIVRYRRISRLYLPDSGIQYLAAMVDDVTVLQRRARALVVRELMYNIEGNDVWLRKSQHALEVLRCLKSVKRVVIEDERLSSLGFHLPLSCDQLEFHFRADWYGKGGASGLESIVKGATRVPRLILFGVTRERDVENLSSIVEVSRQRGLVVQDMRAPTYQEPRSSLTKRIENVRSIVRYHEMRELALLYEVNVARHRLN